MKFKPYPEYKDSGVEWIGMIPNKWGCVRSKFVFNGVKRLAKENHVNYGRLALTMGGVVKRSKEDSHGLQPAQFETYQILKENELVFKLIDLENINTSRVGYSYFIGLVSPAYIILSNPKNNNKYYYYFYMDMYYRNIFNSLGGAGVRSAINREDLLNLNIILPSTDEMEILSSFLDKKTSEIDLTIEKDTRLIELLQEKRTALINHVVTKGLDPNVPMKDSGVEWIGEIPEGWEARRIRTLSLVKRGASPRPIDDPKYFDKNGEYSWVRISDVTASKKYLNKTSEKLSTLGKSLSVPIEPGELFISIAATVGKPIISNIKCCIHDGFIYFQNLQVDEEYLFYIFIGGQAYQGLGKLGTQLNLNTETIAGITIPIPPKDEQILIAKYIDEKTSKIDLTIQKIQNNISLLQEYKKSLIHHVVTGKVDVRDVV